MTAAAGPRFPGDRSGVAILGCGGIARTAHLPAYTKYGVGVAGVWSRSGTPDVREEFPVVERVYSSAEELLSDPAVRIVDIATPPEGRLRWIEAAVEAGKHVLAQKPLTLSTADLDRLPEVLARAESAGLRVAVNQNGRWAPPWRQATLQLRERSIGELVGVTHLHDKPLPPLVGTAFDDVPHMLLTDYLMHWIDITRCWLAESGARVTTVRATDSRSPGQPDASRNPWSATVDLTADTGATATIRIPGHATASEPGCPFWIHGTAGTLRGSVLLDSDRLDLDRGDGARPLPLGGAWFVDGFAGAMGELMSAVAEGREPENSAADAALSVRVVLAGVASAEAGGAPVEVLA